jgi:superfamily II DNA or RNA helicase
MLQPSHHALFEGCSVHHLPIEKHFQNHFDKFDNSFELLKKCSGSSDPKRYYFESNNQVVYYESECVKRAKELGWIGNTAYQAYTIMQRNSELPVRERSSVWGGNLSHPYHPEKLHIFAINAMRLMGKMKQFCYKLPSKINAAEEIIRAFSTMRYITFAQVVETADELSMRLGSEAVVYHTSLKSKVIDGVKISPAKQKKQALEKYAAKEVRGVLTAKALDEGADFPDLELGIVTSFTSAPQQRTQRNGRVGRLYFYASGDEKEATMVYIYAKDTKEYYWLRNAQKKDPRTKWVNSVREILAMEGLLPEAEQAIGFGF